MTKSIIWARAVPPSDSAIPCPEGIPLLLGWDREPIEKGESGPGRKIRVAVPFELDDAEAERLLEAKDEDGKPFYRLASLPGGKGHKRDENEPVV